MIHTLFELNSTILRQTSRFIRYSTGLASFANGAFIASTKTDKLTYKINNLLMNKFFYLICKILSNKKISAKIIAMIATKMKEEASKLNNNDYRNLIKLGDIKNDLFPLLNSFASIADICEQKLHEWNYAIVCQAIYIFKIECVNFFENKFYQLICESIFEILIESMECNRADDCLGNEAHDDKFRLKNNEISLLKFAVNQFAAYFRIRAEMAKNTLDMIEVNHDFEDSEYARKCNIEKIENIFDQMSTNMQNGGRIFFEDSTRYPSHFRISTSSNRQFIIGDNIAKSQGKVVFENNILQLIMYKPLENCNSKVEFNDNAPLLFIPAWINKFYILDLQEKNSLVQYALKSSRIVFMISWINPDASMADLTFDNYVFALKEALINAFEITGRPLDCVGYCLGGTILAILAAYMKQIGRGSYINSLTFLASMLDFSYFGDIQAFISEEMLDLLDNEMRDKGILSGNSMYLTFSFLRPYEMVWRYAMNNYILGIEPRAFDILFWNDDSTNVTYANHMFYLRSFYQRNLLTKKMLVIAGICIDLSALSYPIYSVATIDDHIAPWESVYHGLRFIGSDDKKFILSESGHVAGIINHPDSNKYGFHEVLNIDYIDHCNQSYRSDLQSDSCGQSPNQNMVYDIKKLTKGEKQSGSWWGNWINWLRSHSFKSKGIINLDQCSKSKISANDIYEECIQIEPAPGRYVKQKFYENDNGIW